MKSSRSSAASPLWTLAGLALAGYALTRLRRDPHFFADKVVLITGGSRGLGFALARRLRAEGASLALLARDPEELERARQDLLAIATPDGGTDPGEVLIVPCDLSHPEEIPDAVHHVVQHFGALDVVINDAGIDRIRAKSVAQSQLLMDYAQERLGRYGVGTVTPREAGRRGARGGRSGALRGWPPGSRTRRRSAARSRPHSWQGTTYF